jgi:hypothetical protein
MDREEIASPTNGVGKQFIHMKKTETRCLFLTLYKNQLKMDQRSSYKTENFETTKGKQRKNI